MKHRQFKFIFVVSCVVVMYTTFHWLLGIDLGGLLKKGKETIQKTKTTYEQIKTTVKKTVEQIVTPQVKELIKSQQRAVRENPYKTMVASVRMGNQLSSEEKNYLISRKQKVKLSLERALGRNLTGKYIPTIAMVGSGGGYRAMLCTTGFLNGAQKIGLLDATTYITALSGSTWALGAWTATGMPIGQFKNYLINNITKTLQNVTATELKLIIDMIAVKIAFDQPLTLVDLYGSLLANRLLSQLGNDRQMTYLSKQKLRIQNGNWVYPIYTAVDGREAAAVNPPWFEFTPHEIGCAEYASYVPSWAYGRKFNAGRSVDFAPEQSLGFHLGTYGSAFAVHFGRAWEEITAKVADPVIKPVIEEKIIKPIAGKRVTATWAEVHNYMFGMTNQLLKNRPDLKLVDAGIAFNLPYPPISGERPERKADIIIFLDASGDVIPDELKKTENYARRKGLKFPRIDYTNLDRKTISVFKDIHDPSVPVVIYMPRISDPQLWQQNRTKPEFSIYSSITGFDMETCTNKGYCETSRFQYTLDQSKKVVDQMEFNMVVNKDTIMREINWLIDKKS